MYFSRATALLLIGAFTCAGCGSASTEDGQGVDVVAAFYPLAYTAERVGGDLVTVTNMTSPGVEPHDLAPTPRDTAAVASADLVIIEEGFQPAIDETAKQNAEGTVLDAAKIVDLVPFADQEDGAVDPHFWLDPTRMGVLADAVATELAKIDPANKSAYAANADAFRSELDALDLEYAEGLSTCERDTVVVSHDAFGYLAKYDLTLEAIVGLSPDAEATPGGLAKLKEIISEDGVTTVFAETLASPELAQTLADEAGVTTGVLDPIEGLSDESSEDDYLSIMRSNLTALRAANGC